MKTVDIAYHYTSIDSLYKILGIAGDDCCFRATNAYYLNDPSEYIYAIQILLKSMRAYEKQNGIKDRKSDYFPEFKRFFSGLSHMPGDPYILSFSDSGDELSMWRAYGKDGTGVAIGLDLAILSKKGEEPNTKFIKCIYDQNFVISKLIDLWKTEYNKVNIENHKTYTSSLKLLTTIFFLCFAAKRQPYNIENECRLCKNETSDDIVEFRVCNNVIIPFITHRFKKDIVKKIVIGPCSTDKLVKKSLELFLEKYGYPLNKSSVVTSRISYRQL